MAYLCSLIKLTYRLQTPLWTAPGRSCCPQVLWECSLTAWPGAAEYAALTLSQSSICLSQSTQWCRRLPSSCTAPSATGCYPSGRENGTEISIKHVAPRNWTDQHKWYVTHLFPNVIQHNGSLFFIHQDTSVICVSWEDRERKYCITHRGAKHALSAQCVWFLSLTSSSTFWWSRKSMAVPFIFSLRIRLLDVFLTAALQRAGLAPRWSGNSNNQCIYTLLCKNKNPLFFLFFFWSISETLWQRSWG